MVLLNFWATWCAPCRVEMPVFAAWQRRYGPRGLQVIGISMDDDAAPVRRLAARLKLDYPIAMGDASLGEQSGGVLGLPITYLIGRNGVVRAEFEGGGQFEGNGGEIDCASRRALSARNAAAPEFRFHARMRRCSDTRSAAPMFTWRRLRESRFPTSRSCECNGSGSTLRCRWLWICPQEASCLCRRGWC